MRNLFAGIAGILLLLAVSPAFAADLTGSWFDPDNTGYGINIDQAPDSTVVYWYDYESGVPGLTGDQLWLVGHAEPGDTYFKLYRPVGTWGGQAYAPGEPIGYLEFNIDTPLFSDSFEEDYVETIDVSYHFWNLGICQPVMVSPTWDGCGGTRTFTRLTRRQ